MVPLEQLVWWCRPCTNTAQRRDLLARSGDPEARGNFPKTEAERSQGATNYQFRLGTPLAEGARAMSFRRASSVLGKARRSLFGTAEVSELHPVRGRDRRQKAQLNLRLLH